MKTPILIALLATSILAKDIPMAVVVRVKGRVAAGPPKALKPVKSGDVISKDWVVKTESDGSALLRLLKDKSLADVKASSTVELDARSDGAGTVQDIAVLSGQVAFQVPSGGDGNKGRTETTVATAKGAQFGMSTATNGSTRVDVLTGTVQVCNQMTGEHKSVQSGQSLVSGYEGFGELRQVASDSSLARMDAPAGQTVAGEETTQLQVPFTDPVTGKTSTLVVQVRRNRRGSAP